VLFENEVIIFDIRRTDKKVQDKI